MMFRFRKIAILSLLALLIMVSACGPDHVTYKTKNVDDLFSFDMPTYMMKLDLENPDATLEYGNELKEHYVMAIVETVADIEAAGFYLNIKDYSEIIVNHLKEGLNMPKVQKIIDDGIKQEGFKAITFKVWGELPENDQGIFYYLTIFKDDYKFVSFYTWTKSSSENQYIKIMEHMVQSFKTL